LGAVSPTAARYAVGSVSGKFSWRYAWRSGSYGKNSHEPSGPAMNPSMVLATR
jgi:hypothetical protein